MTVLDDPPTRSQPRVPSSAAGSPPSGPPRSRPDSSDRDRRPRRRSRRRRVLRTVAICLAVLLIPVGWSYGHYLTAPGDAPVEVRSVDWLRDHGFDSAVSAVEQWWYTRKKPTGSTPPTADIPTALRHATTAVDTAVTAAKNPAPGEAQWVTVTGLASQPGAVAETFLHPDAAAGSVVADVVRFDQSHLRTVLVPGLVEPGGVWAWHAQIPAKDRSTVIAAFNAGFKFKDTAGGMYAEGRHAVRPLQAGLASLVIGTDGRADVVAWRGSSEPTSSVASVRQNLALIVDGGRPATGLQSDRGSKWGTKKSQFQYTWRSAVGVDAEGRLIYAAGSQMTLVQLANAMVDAGAVRAMQLDIHSRVVTFNWFRPDPSAALGVAASKLTSSMQRSATRYLTPDQRDFIAVQAR